MKLKNDPVLLIQKQVTEATVYGRKKANKILLPVMLNRAFPDLSEAKHKIIQAPDGVGDRSRLFGLALESTSNQRTQDSWQSALFTQFLREVSS